jgi:hydrogenase-4 component F
MSALLSPAYLRNNEGHFFSSTRSVRSYYLALYLFWAALITIPVVNNLGVAWVVVEATTGASAVLVAFSGKPRALEASWKYLMLTTLGLSLAFLGIVIICLSGAPHGAGLAELNWSALPQTLSRMPHRAAAVAYALVMLGLAAKIGWAPLQNWLPDAHSEAPAPISAMLSSVLLPAVILLAWRLRDAAIQPLGHTTANAPLVVFGILSVAVAVPFLWQPMPWKRLMAYHTLEHMGIITVGIAISTPLAIAGVLIHVAGHALAKALGFYATIPLFQIQPDAAHQPAHNAAVLQRALHHSWRDPISTISTGRHPCRAGGARVYRPPSRAARSAPEPATPNGAASTRGCQESTGWHSPHPHTNPCHRDRACGTGDVCGAVSGV